MCKDHDGRTRTILSCYAVSEVEDEQVAVPVAPTTSIERILFLLVLVTLLLLIEFGSLFVPV